MTPKIGGAVRIFYGIERDNQGVDKWILDKDSSLFVEVSVLRGYLSILERRAALGTDNEAVSPPASICALATQPNTCLGTLRDVNLLNNPAMYNA